MQIKVQCYAVIRSRLQPGIPAVWRNPNGQIERPLGEQVDDSAIHQHIICHRQNNLPGRRGVLVAVYPLRLKLEGRPLAVDLNFWPGGEVSTSYGAWKQSSNCQGPRKNWPADRYEIYLLFGGERLIICDNAMRVAVMVMKQGEPTIYTPTPVEMVDYITTVGLRTGTHRSLTWAINNLEAIKREHPKVPVSKHLKTLRGALPTTPAGVSFRT